MLTPREWSAIALAACARRAVVCGGFDCYQQLRRYETTEILDITTEKWSRGSVMATGRDACAAFAVDERCVLVAGGWDGRRALATTELLDLDACACTPGPELGAARMFCAGAALDGARCALVVGGSSPGALATTELLDFATMRFAPGPAMRARREACAAVALDARVHQINSAMTSNFACVIKLPASSLTRNTRK